MLNTKPASQYKEPSATRMPGRRAAAAHLGIPRPVLTLQHIERFYGVAIIVEAYRAAEAGEALQLSHVVANLGTVGVEVVRLAGDAAGLDGGDVDAGDLV